MLNSNVKNQQTKQHSRIFVLIEMYLELTKQLLLEPPHILSQKGN